MMHTRHHHDSHQHTNPDQSDGNVKMSNIEAAENSNGTCVCQRNATCVIILTGECLLLGLRCGLTFRLWGGVLGPWGSGPK